MHTHVLDDTALERPSHVVELADRRGDSQIVTSVDANQPILVALERLHQPLSVLPNLCLVLIGNNERPAATLRLQQVLGVIGWRILHHKALNARQSDVFVLQVDDTGELLPLVGLIEVGDAFL